MDAELKKWIYLITSKGALTNGMPTSSSFSNLTDSLENIRDELVVADAAIDAVQVDLGDQADAATADDLSNVTTTSALAKLRLLLNRLSSDAFTATIQGGARTELDTMLAQLATYLSAAGAAWSVQINNNTARTNLEQVLEDLSVIFGADNANVFNPTIQGAARTDLDTALAQLATYLSALGAAYSSTVNPGGTAKTNIEEVLEDLGNVLAGTGIVTYPAGAAPADGISIAEGLRYVSELTDSTEAAGPYSYLDAGGEQDVYTDATVVRRQVWLEVSNRNMTQSGTFKVYRKVDGSNYDLWASDQLLASGNRVLDYEFTTNQHWKVSYTEDADEGAARNIEYNVITKVIE